MFVKIFKFVLGRTTVVVGALGLTLGLFLILPLMQAIGQGPGQTVALTTMDTALPPPPPPPPEEEPEEEEQPEDEPPELTEEAPPLDLSQLELALNNSLSGDFLGGDFAVNLSAVASSKDDVDALFSMADLDQQPRVVYQPGPVLDAKMRKLAPGKVNVIFIVDARGRVENPRVLNASDPIFERPALAAVKQWKFEPGKRNGKAVRFRMKVPITFPKQ